MPSTGEKKKIITNRENNGSEDIIMAVMASTEIAKPVFH